MLLCGPNILFWLIAMTAIDTDASVETSNGAWPLMALNRFGCLLATGFEVYALYWLYRHGVEITLLVESTSNGTTTNQGGAASVAAP